MFVHEDENLPSEALHDEVMIPILQESGVAAEVQ